uniref:C2H2-type domain-containing protein n=1 Tax=Monopterus albus TaxID=43700 RepID=A0A3Q3J0X8_MONAL|nr:zinc finger protein 462-like isoform X2 [Monopterus albus]
MQKDSVPFSSSGHKTHDQALTEECPVKSFQCSECTLVFKSKVYLFEHLTKVHSFDVDSALKAGGLKKQSLKTTDTDNSPGIIFLCQHCDFKAGNWDILNSHEKQCHKNIESPDWIGNLNILGSPETKIIILTNQHKEGGETKEIPSAFSGVSTSKTKCTLNSSKDLGSYKRPSQTITNYFAAASGSNGESPRKLSDTPMLLDSTEGTLVLQESSSSSSPNHSSVLKVAAKSTIDMSKNVSDQYLRNDHLLITDLRPPKPKEEFKETVHNSTGKRMHNESSESHPAKKAKLDNEETQLPEKANTSEQQSSNRPEVSFEDIESPNVYFCKHCDYSDVDIRCVSNHYQNNHPYIRYDIVYIENPSDQSAAFRCLECPVEFLSVADLKIHYTEHHPEAPNVFTMQSCELSLVFKCFTCPFTTSELKDLKEHYRETHPTHKVDNPLLYYKYSGTRCQEGSSKLSTSEKDPSPERSKRISPASDHTPWKEVKSAASPQHLVFKRADGALYHCNNCNFSHKSAVVMHVHYQKSHSDEAVTMNKIKPSDHVTSHATSEVTPEKSPKSVSFGENSTSQKDMSNSSNKAKDDPELSQQKIPLSLSHTPEDSTIHSDSSINNKVESAEDKSKRRKSPTKCNREMSPGNNSLSSRSAHKMFYCQFCVFASTNVKSVLSHHNAKHAMDGPTCIEDIVCYSGTEQKKKLQRDTKISETPSDRKTRKQIEVCSNEFQHEEGDVAGASVTTSNAYECAEKLFYCQKCNFGNPTIKGVLNHQHQIHQHINTSHQCILDHTALIHEEIKKSKFQTKKLSFATHLPPPLMKEGDEDRFFCHFCNYRHSAMNQVLKHYSKVHRGFGVNAEHIHLYTSEVLEQTQKLRLNKTKLEEINHAAPGNKGKEKKKKKLVKCFSLASSPSVRASQTQRTLRCHRCTYTTQYLYMLRRHMWKTHRSNRSVQELLRMLFIRGNLQTGYHCDWCVFSHKNAATLYQHYQEQHPERKISLEFVSKRLYAGPDTSSLKRKKREVNQTDDISHGDCPDGSSLSQRSAQNETKTYSCRACPFKGSSTSSLIRHYRAVHPWSVKEDGSVLDVITSKKSSANNQLEDHSEIPGLFDTYQVPLEDDKSSDSSHEGTVSPTLKCHYCPARFHTQHGLNTHCGMKHQIAVTENLDEKKELQIPQIPQIPRRLHIFKCPHCTYVNTNYHGVLTHCQMKHPALVSRADSLHVDGTLLHNLEDCLKQKHPNSNSLRLSGYMCKTCSQIFVTLEKLNMHCEKEHNETVTKPLTNKLKPAPKSFTVVKLQQYKAHSAQGAVSKVSFLHKKKYAVIRCQHCSYICSTNIALSRHMHVHHMNTFETGVKEGAYKCALCSSSYFRKKRLGDHYTSKHGQQAFLEYYVQVYKKIPQKSMSTSPDHPSTWQTKDTSEARKSITATGENKIVVYMCPRCPYINASHHGTLTHCQMKHPDLVARADELQTEEILVRNMIGCTMGKGSNERGYMCKNCPQIYASLKKLKIHSVRSHNQADPAASEHSDERKTKKLSDHGSRASVVGTASSKYKTVAVSATNVGQSQEVGTPKTCQSKALSVQKREKLYKCNLCTYKANFRRYLYVHYRNTHKLDALTTYKLLEKYNKCNHKLPNADSKESIKVKCKKCPNLMFNSSRLLIAHYSTFHCPAWKLDFTVLSERSHRSTGIYKCTHCKKRINGIRNLSCHLDRHRAWRKKKAAAAKTEVSLVITTAPEAKSSKLCSQDEVTVLDTVEELAQWSVTPVETFTLPASPQSSPSNPTELEQPELESRKYKHTCSQCARTFMSLTGLRSHERSHAALAAIKKLDNLPPSAVKSNVNKYVLYKPGTLRPFRCSCCPYRTTLMGIWRSHFMKNHQDVIMDPTEIDIQHEESTQRTDKEPPSLSEENKYLPEPAEEHEMIKKSLYLESPDVQRQLNQYSLMAQTGFSSKTNLQETMLPESSLLHCELCNFSTGHLSSVRRHYLNRHGKKILKCKDCDFFTGIRKTLEVHMETGHSTCQSEPTHQKDLRCPFCLYQTKNKNNMIDHIILHREQRVVPIEVRRPKLSRYLKGIVFRCHKCTFTSGSAENLRLHMMRHDDIKPYKCRLCYFDCTQLSDLEAHLSDKHQVIRNHELVGHVSLDELEERIGTVPEEEDETLSNLEHNNCEDEETGEFVTDCNEVPHETLAKSLAESDIKEKSEQDPQEQAGIVSLPDTARGQGIKNIVEQNVGKWGNADIQFVDCSVPEEENHAQPKPRGHEDSSIKFTQQKNEGAAGSSTTYCKVTETAQVQKLHSKTIPQRTLNKEARVEGDVLPHTLVSYEDGSINKMHKKADQGGTVKMEQDTETEIEDNIQNAIQLLDEKGSITLVPKNQANMEEISVFTKKNYMLANNNRAHQGSPGVSFTNCKEEEVLNQQSREDESDHFGEMPVLKHRLKEEMSPLGCCKEEEEETDDLVQEQDTEEEMIPEDEKRQEPEEGHNIKEADSPHVHRDTFTTTDGAAEVLSPLAAEKKLYSCEFCGRTLMNSCELERHVMRHGI